MPFTYVGIRHGCDSFSHTTYKHKHDTPLCDYREHRVDDFKDQVYQLIKKEGLLPHQIYASPFLRGRQTAQLLAKEIKRVTGIDVPITLDVRLSRLFANQKRDPPDIGSETATFKVPLKESSSQFRNRVKEHLKFVHSQQAHKKKAVIWCVTHSLVLRKIARFHGEKERKNIKPLEYFIYEFE